MRQVSHACQGLIAGESVIPKRQRRLRWCGHVAHRYRQRAVPLLRGVDDVSAFPPWRPHGRVRRMRCRASFGAPFRAFPGRIRRCHRPFVGGRGRRRGAWEMNPGVAGRIWGRSSQLAVGRPGRAAATVAGVLTGSGSTWDPSHATDSASGDGLLSFTLYRRGVPAALLQIGTAPTLQLNRRGYGWAWSLDAATKTAAYQQDRRGNSDLKLYDWSSGLRTNPGGTVNTPRWEYEPAVSGHWLVFARLNRAAAPDVRRILLANLQTNQLTELARFKGSAATGTLSSPQIDGDWVDVDVDEPALRAVERTPVPDLHRARRTHPPPCGSVRLPVGGRVGRHRLLPAVAGRLRQRRDLRELHDRRRANDAGCDAGRPRRR